MMLSALQDLFRHCREKSTGLWKLGQEPSRTIFLDGGDIVFAQSTHPADRLTYLLVERGKLTQAQLDYALANLKPGLSIGKNLIEMGFITQRDLLEVARAQVERVLHGALGTPDQLPDFEARDLDATVVRLPLDTPQLLLNALLGLQDRERLLELLGPLNQVVVLQGRRLQEMPLPADLAKLPPLLDGTRTLLELSREASLEPLRLGMFALFLREIGWARLHEMPPLDRQALDLALAPEPEPPSPPLPEPPAAEVPSLFSTIEAAARPTTNLEQLSRALDDLPELPELPSDELPPLAAEPEDALRPAPGFELAPATALLELPTPSMELPEIPDDAEEGPEPQVALSPATLSEAEPAGVEESAHSPRGRKVVLGLAAAVLVAAGAFGWWWFDSRMAAPPSGTPPAAPTPRPAAPEPAAPEPAGSVPTRPAPETPVKTAVEDRLAALRRGDLELAVRQGRKYLEEDDSKPWTLRLEIACMGETLQKAVDLFPDRDPDLFIVPIALRDGRSCYQLFCGRYASRAAAERQARALPRAFHEGGNRPRPYALSEIPGRQ